MEFTDYTNTWAKGEVLQGKIMIAIGIFLSVAFISIYRSEHQLLRGSLIPLGLLLAILLGYGSFILYSRPAHAKEIIQLYQKNPNEAVKQETTKHINDNKAGKLLIRIYPILMLISVIAFIFVSASYYKGMALGFVLLFVSMFIIDNGFVSRSNAFLSFLNN
jgi:Ca2+/H+ antiporter